MIMETWTVIGIWWGDGSPVAIGAVLGDHAVCGGPEGDADVEVWVLDVEADTGSGACDTAEAAIRSRNNGE